MIFHETRKRRAVLVKEEISNLAGSSKDNRLLKILNNQGREEDESRVVSAILLVASRLMWFNPPLGRIW
jgi:hypothetical protein